MKTIGSEIIHIDKVGSTNSFLKESGRKKLREGTVVSANFQDQGRGTGTNSWISEHGANLLFSFIVYPDFLSVENQFMLSKTVSLGITDFLKTYCGDIKIKWPNDIYVGNEKIAGILIENTISAGCISNSVVGIGLNLNQIDFPQDLPNPVSLKKITGADFNLQTTLENLLGYIDSKYSELKAGYYEDISEKYSEMLFHKNVLSEFSIEDKIITAKILGTDNYGQLLLVTESGEVEAYGFHSVRMIL